MKFSSKLSKWCFVSAVLFINYNICAVKSDLPAVEETCDRLYEFGVNAYLEEHWTECIDALERAVQLYNTLTKSLVNCRLRCQQEVRESDPMFPVNIENLHFYEYTIKNTLCVLKCKNAHGDLFKNYTMSEKTEKIFEDRKPYEYLHICYFQKNKIQDAASAAFTYLVTHPEDKAMMKNLRFYSSLPEVDMSTVLNFEAKDYVYLYIHGSNAYENKDWKSVIDHMEESLLGYLQAEEECRAQCEGPFDQGWFPDFTASIANHFTFCLKCKRRCPSKLNTLNGEVHDDLLPSHYHFLQYAYYKTGNLRKACETVASYLLFYPTDETMLTNMEYYKKLPKVEDAYFTPRQEAVEYIQRQGYEERLLDYVETAFVFDSNEDDKENEISKGNLDAGNETNRPASKRTLFEHLQDNIERSAVLIMDEIALNGTNRFVSEGMSNEAECSSMMQLAQMYAVQGDGYHGNKSPHTNMESFEGVTIGRAALLVYFGLMEPELLELYLALTENAQGYIERYFGLTSELYFTYTHLVCRSALPGAPVNRTDFSHAIHADNCNLQDDGQCFKEPPSYTWRDYSAIIYLNDDFDGGEFVFSNDKAALNIQSTIKPKCGRMIGFSAGAENLHGVRAVLRGTRCAVGMWFTLNPRYQEVERLLAYKLLDQIKARDGDTDFILNQLEKYITADMVKMVSQ